MTSTIAFEGDGRVVEYVGGYDDWLRQRPAPAAPASAATAAKAARPAAAAAAATLPAAKKRLTFKEQRELADLPARIEALETELRGLEAEVAGPDFYKAGTGRITEAMARLAALPAEITAAYARWDDLESRADR